MRVFFYVSSPVWSASARVAITAAKGLAARGHEVAVACAEGSQLAARTSDARIDAVTMGKSASAAGDAWDLRRAMEHRSIEVAIVTNERDHLVVASARLLGNRGAVLRHVRPLERIQLGRSGKLALKLAASGLIFSSEKDATESTLKGWAVPPCIAPLGVDPAPFDAAEAIPRGELGLSSDALLVACSYEPSGRARIATVLRALALLTPRHPELHAVVFGPGSLDEALRMHASALAVNASVTLPWRSRRRTGGDALREHRMGRRRGRRGRLRLSRRDGVPPSGHRRAKHADAAVRGRRHHGSSARAGGSVGHGV